MNHALTTALADAMILTGAVSARAQNPDWMTDEAGVLELKLAHADKGRPDGGVLRVDRGKREVSWEGIPGDIGCKQKVQTSFDDVKFVGAIDDGAGFTIEFTKAKPRKLLLIPVAHVSWLSATGKVEGGLGTAMSQSSLRGPGGDQMTASGGAAGAGPSVRKAEIPKAVKDDCKKAAGAVQAALAGK
jgi:hypothetical protein